MARKTPIVVASMLILMLLVLLTRFKGSVVRNASGSHVIIGSNVLSGVVSLLIRKGTVIKVYIKRENAGSWDSGLEKEQILENYSAQLQKS
ncbi:hypothetical protein TRIUR3_14132 [Triticum urartu]|uniref:Uncharacterized protein n=1 Tax=Triticum urartu TaxID=4572 RepID=M7ZRN0_TRIUA|nr:hypothetical protein TRIUR3_14132 [Triticum urartu]